MNTTFEAFHEKKLEHEEDKTKLAELQKRANQLEKDKDNIERTKSHLEIMVSTLSQEPHILKETLTDRGKKSMLVDYFLPK